MNYQVLEKEIQDKGLNAPRLTPESIEATISTEDYIYSPLAPTLTICILILKNGFTVVGESACASPENFNKELGQKIARDNAKEKIWVLEGYVLKHKLFNGYANN